MEAEVVGDCEADRRRASGLRLHQAGPRQVVQTRAAYVRPFGVVCEQPAAEAERASGARRPDWLSIKRTGPGRLAAGAADKWANRTGAQEEARVAPAGAESS